MSLALGATATLPSQALAQAASATRAGYVIPPGPLARALDTYARLEHITITYDATLIGSLQSPGLKGRPAVAEGLNQLLAGTGLAAIAQPDGGYTLKSAPAGTVAELPVVSVTAGAASGEVTPYAGGQVNTSAALGLLGGTTIMNAPFNVTSFSSQLIADQQARTVGAVVENDPSVRLVSPPGSMYQDFTIRGFYQDAISVNGLYGLSFGDAIPAEIADRIEVIKGPTALIGGMPPSGAVGGLINVQTKRAGDQPLNRVTLDYTSDGQVGTQVDLSRRFGDQNEFGIRFNGVYRDGDTSLDHNASRLALGALGLDYRGSRLRASLDVVSQRSAIDGFPRYVGFSGTGEVPAAPRAEVNPFAGSRYDVNTTTVMGRAEYDLNDNWMAYLAGGKGRNRSTFLGINAIGKVNDAGNFTAAVGNGRYSKDGEVGQAGLRGKFLTGPVSHQISFAVDQVRTKGGSNYVNGPSVTSNIYDPVSVNIVDNIPSDAYTISRTTLQGLSLADTLGFLDDRVLLTVGGRKQWIKTESFNKAGDRTAKYDDDALTPMLGILVKPWSNVSLYANYIEGLTAGSTVTDTLSSSYGQTFAPYKSKQYETGVKWDMGSFTNTLSLFQIEKPSLIKNPTTTAYSADGKQRNRGVEWNGFGAITDGVRLLAGASYTRAVVVRSAGDVYNGKQAFGVPKWLANVGVEWDLPWIAGASLNARAIYTGGLAIDSANTQTIPSWIRYDAGARYATNISGKPVTFRLNVQNLFNHGYWIGQTYLGGYVIKGAPRSVMLSASIDF
ncbi:TonB-dependent receptor [Bordetella genomosp. 12]|uniref:TonB-dependent receptor n=1 Tax=Bordetella genomosp. 12 TaxID=463035 RepID=UPI00142DFA7A|nr:TonB-dependent receptor [Bordetella genomosp. 12]